MRIERVVPTTGMRQYPGRNRAGRFVVGDPAFGGKKRRSVATEDEAICYIVTMGYYVMVQAGDQQNMVRLNLFIDGKRVT